MNAYSAEAAHTLMLLAMVDLRLDSGARLAAVADAYRETLRRDQRYFPVRIELARFLQQRGRGTCAHCQFWKRVYAIRFRATRWCSII